MWPVFYKPSLKFRNVIPERFIRVNSEDFFVVVLSLGYSLVLLNSAETKHISKKISNLVLLFSYLT